MTSKTLIYNQTIINDYKEFKGYVIINGDYFEKIDSIKTLPSDLHNYNCINAEGKIMIPGVIDTHVHFREPGLTGKADMESESKAALAGGVTSIFDMPNTIPQTTSLNALKEKLIIASERCKANYAFFYGVSNSNLDEILNIDKSLIPGVKLFLGSSTGDMLVSRKETIEGLFKNFKKIIAAHCEDESIINENKKIFQGEDPKLHIKIRSREACIKATKFATDLALKNNSKFHVCHLSTKEEVELLSKIKNKNITSEVSVHHLFFEEKDYNELGNLIKVNPSIKLNSDKEALWEGISDGTINIIATDHAPHKREEKNKSFSEAPSGTPMIQFSLPIMFSEFKKRKMDHKKLVDLMAHAPAKLYGIKNRGFINEGFFADFALLKESELTISDEIVLSKCGWTPLSGKSIDYIVTDTYINGKPAYSNGVFSKTNYSEKLDFIN